ncbi:hypothetical protein B0H10DRAFT_2229559 [Mycena sp. CBHHK59/15]|nr:hypothetical protein B0H10DRAFT_2229559 [Mycena sp. CBHHK59/15]
MSGCERPSASDPTRRAGYVDGSPSAEMNLGGAQEKLERIVKEMEFLSTSGVDRSAAEKAAATARKSTSASASKQKDRPSKSKNGAPLFQRMRPRRRDVMAGKNRKSDNTYQPRKGPNLSEEEEDDFVDGEEEESASNKQHLLS